MSTPACLFMVYLTQLNINLFQFYSFTNCLSSLFQQSVRLISLCNRLSRSFLSRSNISVARSDDTLVSYICPVLLRNQKSCWRKIMETLRIRTVKIFIHLFFWLTLHILFQSPSFIFMWWMDRLLTLWWVSDCFSPCQGPALPVSALVFLGEQLRILSPFPTMLTYNNFTLLFAAVDTCSSV